MAEATLHPGVFPAGTVVGAYLRTKEPWAAENRAPSSAPDETATVQGDGSLTFTALQSTGYYAIAQVAGVYRYVAFYPPPTADGGGAGSVWYFGTGAPAGDLGSDGDYYLETDSNGVFAKSGDAWAGPIANLAGAAGADGAAGEQGPAGPSELFHARAVSLATIDPAVLVVGYELDGVDLEEDDLAFVSTGIHSGIYIVQASGAAVRTDEPGFGGLVAVDEGDVAHSTLWSRIGPHTYALNAGNGAVRLIGDGDGNTPLVAHDRGAPGQAIGLEFVFNTDDFEFNDDGLFSSILSGDVSQIPNPLGYGTPEAPNVPITAYDDDTQTQSTYWGPFPDRPGSPPANLGPVSLPGGSSENNATFASKDAWDFVQLNGSIDIGTNTTGVLCVLTGLPWKAAPQLAHHAVAGAAKTFSCPYFDGVDLWGFTPVQVVASGAAANIMLLAGTGTTPVLPDNAIVCLDPIRYRALADT